MNIYVHLVTDHLTFTSSRQVTSYPTLCDQYDYFDITINNNGEVKETNIDHIL